ncbi:TetR family transcriptional regulator [Microtetraspora sp. NBRC 13810]|uniref:TetR/AcrR family transcriptional regulator n=1 Tax=Microtetraspora sp. NBRC 13810 TaxID=3030990 RepID=UPI00249FF94C|nr:TetR/AcrR family transcriptional regulator [Microtetraspora sp. NBRC 13810]GLW11285.1 TetR family transcriptional regulator [Microtetraspora sp. NBRC 13810]
MQGERESLRADARRNRDRIVATARVLFVRAGIDVPMDEIMRQAGVGKGTLYRHFPERELLIEAVTLSVYRQLSEMAATAWEQEENAWGALRRFLHDWAEVRFGLVHAGLCERLPALLQASAELRQARDGWLGQVERMVREAQADGTLRPDVGVGDLALFVNMLVQQRDAPAAVAETLPHRFLALFLDGLRAQPGTALPGMPITSAELG